MKGAPQLDLMRLHLRNGHGTIKGVEFDFGHEALGAEWSPARPLIESGFLASGLGFLPGFGLRLIYPWTSFEETPALQRRRLLRGLTLRRDIALHGPYGWIGKGDRLFVHSVQRIVFDDEVNAFESDVDKTVLRVRYAINRADGRTERVHGRFPFRHRDRDWGERCGNLAGEFSFDGGICLAAVERRVATLLKFDEAGDVLLEGERDWNAYQCHNAAEHARTFIGHPYTREDRERALVQAGYFLAKAEAADRMLPFAESGLRARRAQATGAKAKRARADPIRIAAQADFVANPRTTQGPCAARLAPRVNKSVRHVERIIAPMFEWRELAGGGREKQPKAEFLAAKAPDVPPVRQAFRR